MIGGRPGEGRRALDGVKPVHRRWRCFIAASLDIAACGEVARVTQTTGPQARKSASSDTMTSACRKSYSGSSASPNASSSPSRTCRGHRFVGVPPRFGELLEQAAGAGRPEWARRPIGSEVADPRPRFFRFALSDVERQSRESVPRCSTRPCSGRPESDPGRRATGSPPGRRRRSLPRLAGCEGLPSILIGRPMWLSTSTPVPKPSNGTAVAKKSGLPGTIDSGCSTYGTIDSGGSTAQPATPESASEAPMRRRNWRRLVRSSPAPPGRETRIRAALKATSSPASSSRLRQSGSCRVLRDSGGNSVRLDDAAEVHLMWFMW